VLKRTLIALVLSVALGFAGLYLVAGGAWFRIFVLFWLLLKLYGVEADLLATIAALSSVTLVSHVVPTPGHQALWSGSWDFISARVPAGKRRPHCVDLAPGQRQRNLPPGTSGGLATLPISSGRRDRNQLT
jgi:hypothetical protein